MQTPWWAAHKRVLKPRRAEPPKKPPAFHAGPPACSLFAASGRAGQGPRLLYPVAGVAPGLGSVGFGADAALIPWGVGRCLNITVSKFLFTVFSLFHYSRTNPRHPALVETVRETGPW